MCKHKGAMQRQRRSLKQHSHRQQRRRGQHGKLANRGAPGAAASPAEPAWRHHMRALNGVRG